MTQNEVFIRPLGAEHASAYRAMQLEAVINHPEAFGGSPEELESHTDEEIIRDLTGAGPDRVIFGALTGDQLVGMLRVYRFPRFKTRHRVMLGGMYVKPEMRDQGIGRLLLSAGLNHAQGLQDVDHIVLAVTAGNEKARRMYIEAGFSTYSIDPRYLRVGEQYYDIEWMVKRLA